DTSGFSVSIGAQGAQIDFSSLASLVTGAIAFDTFVSGGASVSDGTVFEVYESQEDARNSVFNASAVELLEVRVIFNENISGLVLDAPVELSGLRIGSVTSLSGIIDEEEFGDNRVRLNVVLGIQPARLGLTGDVTAEAALTFLTERVEQGLRARLASGSLLTGGLKVELVNVENVPEAQIILQEGALATLPSTDSEITDASATVEGVFTRINSLPIEDLLQRAIGLLDSVERWINSEEIRGAPEDLRGLFADLRGVLTSESVQEIPEALSATIRRLDAILAQFEEERAVARILDAIDAATEAASRVGGAVDGVPTLIDELTRVATKAVTLPLEELTTEVSDILASTEALLSAPATQELPASLTRALDELNATLAELREGGAVANVNATLSSTRDAADAVALSAQELPKLVDQINSVFEEASATLAGYNRGDVITRDAQAALRDISAAADALTSLVRLLERNPSALIRGR
ncbi:MAG: paraquat-inducible protein B, partial [Pseudomonadota bacterium]